MFILVCAVAIAPFLWETCDRHATRGRLDPTVPTREGSTTTADADLITFLDSVSRSVRSGSSAARAVISAPATSASIADVQRELASGRTLASAATGGHPHVVLLRACAHGDSLSVASLERAIADERFRIRSEHDITVAVAQARRSARILTVLPFAFLLLVAGTSQAVRNHLLSPAVGGAVSIGIILNFVGRSWIARLVTAAARPSPELDLSTAIASTIALHLCAGGSVTDGFESLADRDPRCAEVAGLLRSGHLLAEALRPIETIAPRVVRTVMDSHRDGLPVNTTMTRLADDLRDASTAHIQSRIAQVGVRSTTPLVLCTLPSFLLIGVTPLVLAALAGLSMPTL